MIARRIFAALALLCVFIAPARAQSQSTKAQILAEIPVLCPVGQSSGLCTIANANKIWIDIVSSIMPTAPVTSGNQACFNGTTGLLQDCGSLPSFSITANSTATNGFTSGQILGSNGSVVTPLTTSGSGAVALTNGATFTNPNVGTQTPSDNSTKGASTAYVQNALASIGTGTTAGFQTITAAAAATIAGSITSIITEGYSTANDGGGGSYTRLASTPSPVKAWHFQSADGAWWQLVANPVLPRQVGAALDGSTDDTVAGQAWFDYGAAFGVTSAGQAGTMVTPAGTFNLSANSVTDGRGVLTIKRTSNIVASLVDCSAHNNVIVRNLGITTTAGFTGTGSNTIGNTTQTYTVPSGMTGFVAGNFVQITANTATANRINYEIGAIVSYSGTNLVVNVSTAVGSGTFANWLIDFYPQNGDIAPSPIGLRFTACNQSLMEGNNVTGRFYNAYDSRNGSDVTITRNNAQGWVNRGIHAASYLTGNSAINVQVTYNHLIGGSFAQYGVNTSASDAGVAAGFTIQGNRIEGTTFQGIIMGGAISASAVTDNNIIMAFSNNGVGILIEALVGTDGLENPQHITVGHNNISLGLQGIFASSAFYLNFTGNIVSAANIGYEFEGPTAGSTGFFSVIGNIAQACVSHGFFFSGGAASGITGNSVVGNVSIANGGWGFISDSGTSSSNFSGNVTSGNTTGSYSINTGTGNVTTGGNL
jgi:hypothetical protein